MQILNDTPVNDLSAVAELAKQIESIAAGVMMSPRPPDGEPWYPDMLGNFVCAIHELRGLDDDDVSLLMRLHADAFYSPVNTRSPGACEVTSGAVATTRPAALPPGI